MKMYVIDCYGTKIFVKAHNEKEAAEKLNAICLKETILGFNADNIKEVGDCPHFEFKDYEYYIAHKKAI